VKGIIRGKEQHSGTQADRVGVFGERFGTRSRSDPSLGSPHRRGRHPDGTTDLFERQPRSQAGLAEIVARLDHIAVGQPCGSAGSPFAVRHHDMIVKRNYRVVTR
jgi:hypothetical protein